MLLIVGIQRKIVYMEKLQKNIEIILKNHQIQVLMNDNINTQNQIRQINKMKQSRLDDWQQFNNLEMERAKLKMSPKLEAILDNCQYVLHSQFDKNSKNKNKHKRRTQDLTPQFRQAYKSLSRDEKLNFYIRFVKLIASYLDGSASAPPQLKGVFSSDVYSRSFSLKIWKHKKLRLDRQKHILYAEKDNKIKTYMLEDYLLRKSKNKEYYSFVLQAINTNPHQKSKTVHLGFKQEFKFKEWYEQIISVFKIIQWNFIWSQMKLKGFRNKTQSDMVNSSLLDNRRRAIQFDEDFLSKSVIYQKKQNYEVQKNKYQSNSSSSNSPQQKIQKKNSSLPLNDKQKKISSQSPSKKISLINAQKLPKQKIEQQKQRQQMVIQKEEEQQFYSGQESDNENQQQISTKRMTIIESIAQMGDLDQIQAIKQREDKKVFTSEAKQNIFNRILPEYQLEQFQSTVNYGILHDQANIKIYGHVEQPSKIKMFIALPKQLSQKIIFNCLIEPESFKQANTQVEEISLKTLIKSENSAMMYLKVKAYNKLYRPRDFIYLRHVFTAHQISYVIDKSIQNISFPPFTTIVRGQFCILWGVKKEAERNLIIADINMNNQGYLNDAQNVNLVLKFLKPFNNIEKVIRRKQQILQKLNLFYDDWNIIEQKKQPPRRMTKKKTQLKKKQSIQKNQNEPNVAFKKKKTSQQNQKTSSSKPLKQNSNDKKKQEQIQEQMQFHDVLGKLDEKQQSLIKRYSHMEELKGEIDIKQAENNQKLKFMTVNGIKNQFDKAGNVIISKKFIKNKYGLSPLPKKQLVFQQAINGHPIWKGEWIHDDKLGGIIFIDQKKIQDQKGVLKFILSNIGKNLLSGKSILNISLPVDIFCAQSNLQRLIFSFTYAPTHLEPAVKLKDPLERLKKVIAFGLSNSHLYLNMEKPFNPILGQTFQCWIDGCPVYAEQISHHPPIAAILYYGRGFRMSAQLQSKVELHMNSGCGSNDGIFKIRFDDGLQACYITPGGQVSGLAYGDRKFNIVGKAYYWIPSECLFLQLVFNPAKKGFFSVGKQEQPIDYFEGCVCKVKPDFMQNFIKKRKSPQQKEIIQKYGRVYGIWNKYIQYEDEILLNVDKQFPCKLQYQPNPLPSDANWREDIAYRRILEVSKAQTYKQKLEVFQRKDRKLRQANPNHQPHKK